ncbi:MAG: hypothetical protein WC895_04230 [Candidatus Shapirobacteria bacterium]|jgi:hypothetical protein
MGTKVGMIRGDQLNGRCTIAPKVYQMRQRGYPEARIKKRLLEMFDKGQYEEFCNCYCVEGFLASDMSDPEVQAFYAQHSSPEIKRPHDPAYGSGVWEGGVCLVQGAANTRQELVEKIAREIKRRVENNKIGC